MSSRSEFWPERNTVRVVIFADAGSRAQALAAVLSEEERLEIFAATETHGEEVADVAVVLALSPSQLPALACPIVVLSDLPELRSLLETKGNAWLPLNSSLPELSAAIFAAACDLTVLTSQQLRQWRAQNPEEDAPTGTFVEKLTPRELQVLRMLADGLGNKQIAAQLGLSDHTAKFHVAQILAKLGATSRTEAVTIGIRRGLVPL